MSGERDSTASTRSGREVVDRIATRLREHTGLTSEQAQERAIASVRRVAHGERTYDPRKREDRRD